MRESPESLEKQTGALHWLQEALGFRSQQAFADALDVNTSSVSRWKHPESPRAMRPEHRRRLVQLIGARSRNWAALQTLREGLRATGWDLTEDEWREAMRHLDRQILPAQMPRITLEAFVGRARELAQLKDILLERGPEPAMVFVEGLPGVGKSTLVARLWHDEAVQNRFADGIIWVRMESLVLGETGDTGLRQRAFEALVAQVAAMTPGDRPLRSHWDVREALARKEVLLVLDGVEGRVRLSRWRVVDPILGRLLITTRRRDLSLRESGGRALSLTKLAELPSRELLTRDVPTGEDANLDWLMDLLDGLPLALSLVNSLARQDRGFHLLVDELRHDIFPSLHREPTKELSLRVCFELSYRRLDESGARVFRLLGKFPQPFDITAVAHVLGWRVERVSPAFRSLTALSLVETIPAAPGRYRTHRLLHEYARALAAEHDREAFPTWERRFARYYLDMARRAWQAWQDGAERQALAIWREALAHITQGCDDAMNADRGVWVLGYLAATRFYLGYTGQRALIERWRAYLERLAMATRDHALSALYLSEAYLLMQAPDQAAELLESARDLTMERRLWLEVTLKLVQALLALGRHDRASALLDDPAYQRAMGALPSGDPLHIEERATRGRVCQILGRPEDARRSYLSAVEALADSPATGQLWARTVLLLHLGQGLVALEELDAAVQVFEDGIRVAKAGGYDNFAQNHALHLVIALARSGRSTAARERLRAILEQRDTIHTEALALMAEAEVCHAEGRPEETVLGYQRAAQAVAGTLVELDILLRLGDMLRDLGHGARAVETWQRVRERAKTLGNVYQYAIATLEYGAYLQAQGREGDARPLLLEVVALTSADNPPLAAHALSLLGRYEEAGALAPPVPVEAHLRAFMSAMGDLEFTFFVDFDLFRGL